MKRRILGAAFTTSILIIISFLVFQCGTKQELTPALKMEQMNQADNEIRAARKAVDKKFKNVCDLLQKQVDTLIETHGYWRNVPIGDVQKVRDTEAEAGGCNLKTSVKNIMNSTFKMGVN